jgi:peptidoglycan hydrolase-like protein with peptidoglycan-binding domain
MDTLKHGDSGLNVEQLQTALNLADLTRLPRLTVDGQFNALTVGRVMEFQSLNGLTVDVLDAYDHGNLALKISPISSGRPGFRSTPGMFQMTTRRLRRHSSSEFPGKDNMDFALFYHEGEALHQGNPSIQSHGCIHVPAPHAEQLFDWAGSTDIWVIIIGT